MAILTVIFYRKGGHTKNFMTEYEKGQYISYMQLQEELRDYEDQGASLYMNGKKKNAGDIARACVFQEDDECYMRDYIRDDSGRLVKVTFDRVRNL